MGASRTEVWGVGDDFDDVVQALREKGVTFEHYDTDGNILNVGNAPA